MINKIPNVALKMRIRDSEQKSQNPFTWKEVSTQSLLRDKSTIIFAPACASFDQFKNFENRGAYFNQLILNKLKK